MELSDLLTENEMDFVEHASTPSQTGCSESELFDNEHESVVSAATPAPECESEDVAAAGATIEPAPPSSPGLAPPPPTPAARFTAPVSDSDIESRRKEAVPKNTQRDTEFCIRVWNEWRKHRIQSSASSIPLLPNITPSELQHWLTRFVLEVRKQDGTEYPPSTLLHICSGIQRFIRSNHCPEVDIYKDATFANFRNSLDAEMRRLQSLGLGAKKKRAEPLTIQDEEKFWENGLLGDHTPHALLNTMVYFNGVYFALRSGKEHRDLRFSPSQIEVVSKEGHRAYLLYTEDQSKNHPGGIKGGKISRKCVKHYANLENPSRCFVRLFTLYKSRCPSNPKRNAFYLQPLRKPTKQCCWFSREPLGHNKLSHVVSKMCIDAGIKGYYTNHSLRATTATRLFSAGADEQLIMERTGHRSTDGVRSYKRTSDQQQEEVSDILSLTSSHSSKQSCALPRSPEPSAPLCKPHQPSVSALIPSHSQYISTSSTHVATGHTNNTQAFQCSTSNTSMPGAFNFHSCGSVIINFNK